jgi:polynucleotide 5'-hydroxyl-kinase GRC3/NOL9
MIQEMSMEVPESWRVAAAAMAEDPGITVVLGASDSGKTTFVTYCARSIHELGETVAVVDADVGQSSIGPPTTVGVRLFDADNPVTDPPWPAMAMHFVGSVSPPGHLLPMVVGTVGMTGTAIGLGAARVIVDTTGFVEGHAAVALKRAKLVLLGPKHIALVGRKRSLEEIIAPFVEEARVHRLEVPARCRRRSLEERAANREALLREYFRGCRDVELDTEGLYFRGDRGALSPGRLVGIASTNESTIALGTVVEACGGRAVLRSPLPEEAEELVTGMQLSDFSLPFVPERQV